MTYQLPELVTAFAMLGGGVGLAGFGLKAAAPVITMLRRPAPGGNGNGSSYEKGKDIGALLGGMTRVVESQEKQTRELRSVTAALVQVTAEVHDLAAINRQVLVEVVQRRIP